MLNINELELDQILGSELGSYVGFEWVDFIVSGRDYLFVFQKQGCKKWLWVDLGSSGPAFLPILDPPARLKGEKKPIGLFFQSNLKGQILTGVSRVKDQGRVVVLEFSEDCRVEARLYPSGKNLTFSASNKSLSAFKLIPASAIQRSENQKFNVRSLDEIKTSWLALRESKGSGYKEKLIKTNEKKMAKVRVAIKKAQDNYDQNLYKKWLDLGAWLKENQTLSVPKNYEWLIDAQKPLSWNITNCFEKSKKQKIKRVGTADRISQLKLELKTAESRPVEVETRSVDKKRLLEASGAKGRRKKINDHVTFTIGKSAADNMKLLRKARPWHLWVHLQDEPSAHGFIEVNKAYSLTSGEIELVARSLYQQTRKKAPQGGEKFAVLMAQCRHVRPIKGDRLGRVHYKQESVHLYSW